MNKSSLTATIPTFVYKEFIYDIIVNVYLLYQTAVFNSKVTSLKFLAAKSSLAHVMFMFLTMMVKLN